MLATLSWLDFAESDRQRAMQVIDLFREKSTVDELGFAPIRDALADALFPGTSTIQTRAKYFLFVPWLMKRSERRKGSSTDVAAWLRYDETRLMEALLKGGAKGGVIGSEAKGSLKRMPSSVYWRGLKLWQIRLFDGSIDQYCRWIARGGQGGAAELMTDDKEPVSTRSGQWHPNLPSAPDGVLREASIELSYREAEFLKDRICQSAPGSALGFLVQNARQESAVSRVWEHESATAFPGPLRRIVNHARAFSLCVWGGAIAYGLSVAKLKKTDSELVVQIRSTLQRWSEAMDRERPMLESWDRTDFWSLVRTLNPRLPSPTQQFAERWLSIVLQPDLTPATLESPEVGALLKSREEQLKGPRARLIRENRRGRDLWQGGADIASMDYRWGQSRVILNDILRGLMAGDASVNA
jgi:hypothetical protein